MLRMQGERCRITMCGQANAVGSELGREGRLGANMETKKNGAGKLVRDAKTGRIVKSDEAKKRPSTTVTETIKHPKKKG